ncbi:hypothetical protein [Acetobacter senegalensis]|uniref:hypothetical protein n=1 Tax=Acetobacter senegalensis TaxID=446692 RepID=UPI00128AFD14|nr:hypothetical protein [Acetobacter senegalensis]MCG4256452.1 hypothetical protein [Acetobacter senegalensis]MCG4265991.1 hypothetical protein [Acetobacter senegalensis]MPQ72977.1 hypothetical protein [Acetobacter senegalensis]
MSPLFIGFLAFFFINVAYAQPRNKVGASTPPSQASTPDIYEKPSQQGKMIHLTMDQQMALCAKIEALQKQGKSLPPEMQQEETACQKMDMGQPSSALPQPLETLER